ncbi:MAG: TetR/AcrR family transcriptional regulator, partial [Pseudomonadota bacterium]
VERKGPDGFSIAEACRLAGVSTAAPYKHFSDRNDILRSAVLLAMTRLYEAMKAAVDAHPPRDPARVAALGQSYVDFARAEPGMFRVMFGMTEGQEECPELAAVGEACKLLVEQVAGDHMGVPHDHPAAVTWAYALWCFVHGHSFLQMDDKLAQKAPPEQEATMLRMVGEAMPDLS